MRILRLAMRLPPFVGGMEIHIRELTLEQARQGCEVNLVYAAGTPPAEPGVNAWKVPLNGRALCSWLPETCRFALNASKYPIATGKPIELVHAHGDYAEAWAALRLARKLRCPSVLTIHGGLSDRVMHRCLNRTIFPRLSHIVAVSEDVASQVRSRGVPSHRISVVSSGIHYRRFIKPGDNERAALRQELGIPADAKCLISVGRLHAVKGYRFLIEAITILLSQFPSLRLILVGDGPEEAALKQIAQSTPQILFLGAQPWERVHALLQIADVFVLPSVVLKGQREGTPTSIMEAMAAGLPIVATRTGGIAQLVKEGVNGRLVMPGNAQSLAAGIGELLSDALGRAKMSGNNLKLAKTKDWAVIACKIRMVYESAMAKWRG